MCRWKTNFLSLFTLAVVTLGLFGCASQPAMPVVNGPLEKVYSANFDTVWKAVHTVVKYPLASENQEAGFMETEYIKTADGWRPPELEGNPSSGQRYKILVRLIKGNMAASPSVKVTVEKKVEIQRDFFSEAEPMSSDGLEEKVILYRIEREVLLDKAVTKALSKNAN